MSKIAKIFLSLAILCVVAMVATFPVDSSYAAKSKMVQRVQIDSTQADLFGDSKPVPIGSPQQMIIEDDKAFLPGKTPEGALMADDAYLKSHNIYPLELQTIRFGTKLVRLTAMILMVTFLLGALVTRKMAPKPSKA